MEQWVHPSRTIEVDTHEHVRRVRVQYRGRVGTRIAQAGPECDSLEDLAEAALSDAAMGPVLRAGLGEGYADDPAAPSRQR
jgi:hypothetical protein